MRIKCGLCNRWARFIGSHVMSEHVAYAAGRDAIAAALYAERIARHGR